MFDIRPVKKSEANLYYDSELKIWPSYLQATREQLSKRIEINPNGIIGIWHNAKPVGFAACHIIQFSEHDTISALSDYLHRKGDLSFKHDPKGNCLFLMAGGIL